MVIISANSCIDVAAVGGMNDIVAVAVANS
jgi:hypothetical protein